MFYLPISWRIFQTFVEIDGIHYCKSSTKKQKSKLIAKMIVTFVNGCRQRIESILSRVCVYVYSLESMRKKMSNYRRERRSKRITHVEKNESAWPLHVGINYIVDRLFDFKRKKFSYRYRRRTTTDGHFRRWTAREKEIESHSSFYLLAKKKKHELRNETADSLFAFLSFFLIFRTNSLGIF